jgi:hypothetical protein
MLWSDEEDEEEDAVFREVPGRGMEATAFSSRSTWVFEMEE